MNKKAVWSAAAAAIVVAVIAIAALALLQGGKASRHTGGLDTAYPYEWVEEKNGTIAFTLSAAPEGWVWDTQASDETVLGVVPAENGFSIAPRSQGRTRVSSTLRAADCAEDRVFRVELLIDAAQQKSKLAASVLTDRGETLEGAVRGGAEFDCPYRVWTEDDGSVEVFLTGGAPSDWRVQLRDRSVLRADAFTAADGGVELGFYAEELGVTDAVLYSAERGLSLTLGFASDGAGGLALLSHEMERLDGDAEGRLDFVMAVGEVTIPEGVTPLRWSAGTRGRYGVGTLELGDENAEPLCRLTVTGGALEVPSDFLGDGVVTVHTDGGALYIRTYADWSAAWWEYEGRAFLLECGETETAAVAELAARFMS